MADDPHAFYPPEVKARLDAFIMDSLALMQVSTVVVHSVTRERGAELWQS